MNAEVGTMHVRLTRKRITVDNKDSGLFQSYEQIRTEWNGA